MMLNIVLAFFRMIGRFFSRLFRRAGSAGNTARKAGSGLAAAKAAPRGRDTSDAPEDDELAEAERGGIEAMLFKQLTRPRLSERNASDLTLEEARHHLKQAEIFYTYEFPLFARSDFFYEEVEEQFLNDALGMGGGSIDERFLKIMTLFRRTLNDNTRRLMLVYAPILFGFVLLAGAQCFTLFEPLFREQLISAFPGIQNQPEQLATIAPIISFTVISFVGFLISFLLFSWPFKVAQQRNLLNLDNYLTSKFARINHNFQVAKRRALNVERNKRMSQADELKDEAGVWTLSYQWFSMRLLLCELMIRNRLYQVRRNTTLYWLGGASLCIFVGIVFAMGYTMMIPNGPSVWFATFSATALFILLTYGVFSRTAPMMQAVLAANEWSRFCLVNLHNTIQDHVGEDKVQIVTFRDRNRLE